MIEELKRVGLMTFIFAGGLMAGVIMQTVMAESASGSALEPGVPVIGLQSAAVMALNYTTPALTLSAQRSHEDAGFAVQLTYADGRAARHCTASATLDGHLTQLALLTAKRPLPIDVVRADFPERLGVLELRDGNADAGMGPMTLHARRENGAVAMVMTSGAGEISAKRALFDELARLCTQ